MRWKSLSDKNIEWLHTKKPPLDDVVKKLAKVRALERQVRLIEAHLVGYAMEELLGMDVELEEIPDVLRDPTDVWIDE
jgi:hypothetical protein